MLNAAEVAAAYDVWADPYTERFGEVSSLATEDRELVLGWAAARRGPVIDAGCGPGTWTPLIGARHRAALGLDLSERFVATARRRHPRTPFLRGSLEALPVRTGTLDGLLAWYSLIHTPPERLPSVLQELRRTLRTDGSLLVGFVDGAPAAPFDHTVVTAWSWSCQAFGALLADAGFAVREEHRRHDTGVRPHAALVATAVDAPATTNPATTVARPVLTSSRTTTTRRPPG